jgi:GLPGLI family protein
MKNLLLTFLTVASIFVANAQLKEGHIVYKIESTTDNPDMEMAVGMMQGSTMEVYFKDKATRGEFKMGSMMTTTTISDETSGDVLMLMSGMMGNMAIKSNNKDQKTTDLDSVASNVEVTITKETKVIEGYTCKKAIVTDDEGDIANFWFTEEIIVSKKGQNSLSDDVPGFPMQFEINKGGMTMSMTVTKVETSLPKNSKELFSMTIPEGYKEMTPEQMKQMGMSGM